MTEVSRLFKKGLLIAGGVAVVYYTLIFVINPLGRAIIRQIAMRRHPPNPVYGVLEPTKFEEQSIEIIGAAIPKYTLNTKTGKLPNNIPPTAPVYEFKPIKFSYTAGQNARDQATYFGFTDENLTTDLKGSVYKWRDLRTGIVLEMDITNGRVRMDTPQMEQKSRLFKVGGMNESYAERQATDMLKKLLRFDDALYPVGTNEIYLGEFYGNKIRETDDPRKAQIARVDLFRSIGEHKILGPDPKKGLLHVWVGPLESTGQGTREIVTPVTFPKIELDYWEINAESGGIYPIISVQQAWNIVKAHGGVIANATPKGGSVFEDEQTASVEEVLVNEIYLAYYETPAYQKYMQPIFVFEGNYVATGGAGGDITIYFPAVTAEWTKQ